MQLEEKIIKKKAKIGVVGLGYVGLPLAVEYASKGFTTIGIDIDKSKVEKLNRGENYILDVDSEKVKKLVKSGRLSAVSDYSAVDILDVIFICVPTPFNENKEPNISHILDAVENIAKKLRHGQLIILKSTTFPTTTENYVLPILEKTGLRVGKDFFLAFSPERIDPGNKEWNLSNTPVIVGGVTPECARMAEIVIKQISKNVHLVSSPRVAEMAKLLENIFRSVNIALVNELAQLCDRIGNIDIWEVIEAASTKPFGFMPFYPGPGIGGHCILVDPYYLSWFAKAYDFHTNFIELAAETNESMPFYIVNLILRELSYLPKTLKDANILFLGVAFKRNVNDTRLSPAIKIMELLMREGAINIFYNDPYVPEIWVNSKKFESIELNERKLQKFDIVVITTDHSIYDFEFIVRNSKVIIDTRNATKGIENSTAKIVRLGAGMNRNENKN
ncbi:UDP-N-acetyl-D-glucosamine dehydrogenase [Candidatus Kryptonium thompsonii]|uniref:UDP-N-acetyl-D-glucosamine dehydrogenase n=2 Tax=Candidatus Kryptonium thompsonii TaxID=1633631 RepID=A0A0P1LDE1_9BACT|nr:nucleotide sugar dehydrogenase [Candidatus Kryptonium thompsoni]CUS78002.1 UDP-N-acetyl-D-glucosamine dehydrogenase [Candidatus Kryptonium thompsoni]CUS79311.1 UDP-N-acetyl-D-glucosamine dehydrogenase [Candidatus Kryptonium thompsoni]CUS80922.1 UDP-N-acetyl-D-glucosamine dehydrogenase [Candidatus Kryptonium thompsoni]CUS86138.1 UDP-N-acetyl-D-glucosamine dehydrogenase [Candidatus Kryptonium thompsoni]CUS95933.1 UDP-N-acetyl-D-glucosamine dehydrogenase [Candidatus Kryptonium thompsoni]